MPAGPNRLTAEPAANVTRMNAAEPHARASPNRSRWPTIRTARLSTIGVMPAHAAASRPIASASVSGAAAMARSPAAAADSRPAARIGSRGSSLPSAIAPQLGAATRLTAAWRAISAPTVPRSSPRDPR
jgi:hypothetical protein